MAERFTFGMFNWDIDKAKALLAQSPRKPVRVSVDKLRANQSLINVDAKHAMTTNLKNPGIMGWLYIDGTWFNILIDGNHRLYKAAQLKRKTLPVYVLTKEENYEIVSGPAREQLDPGKPYVADYQARVSRKNPSRDRYYRQKVSEFLDELSEDDWQKQAGNFQKLHRKLITREDPAEPNPGEFRKLEKLIRSEQCPAEIQIDWIYFGGKIEDVKHRVYVNLNPETFEAESFCQFIDWFAAEHRDVAYAKIPSTLFNRRFYSCHDSFIIYTSVEEEEILNWVEPCLDKLVELGLELEHTPSEFYIQPEGNIETSFHLELARTIQETLQEDLPKFESIDNYVDFIHKEISLPGKLTAKLLAKNLIL